MATKPKDKFYRRYAAAYVLGIPAVEVPEHSWKQLFPRIYAEDPAKQDTVLLEKFRTTKAMMKGLPGRAVIEMVVEAQGADTMEPAKLDAPKPAPKAKAPKQSKADAPKDDTDAINKAFGLES